MDLSIHRREPYLKEKLCSPSAAAVRGTREEARPWNTWGVGTEGFALADLILFRMAGAEVRPSSRSPAEGLAAAPWSLLRTCGLPGRPGGSTACAAPRGANRACGAGRGGRCSPPPSAGRPGSELKSRAGNGGGAGSTLGRTCRPAVPPVLARRPRDPCGRELLAPRPAGCRFLGASGRADTAALIDVSPTPEALRSHHRPCWWSHSPCVLQAWLLLSGAETRVCRIRFLSYCVRPLGSEALSCRPLAEGTRARPPSLIP